MCKNKKVVSQTLTELVRLEDPLERALYFLNNLAYDYEPSIKIEAIESLVENLNSVIPKLTAYFVEDVVKHYYNNPYSEYVLDWVEGTFVEPPSTFDEEMYALYKNKPQGKTAPSPTDL
jgi:hypothetical protein